MPNVRNIRDYLLHITNEPPFYQRNCEQDLPSTEKESNISRAAQIALPYICLYNPAAKAISLGMGTLRCGSRAYETHTAWKGNKTWTLPMAQTAFALASLAITFFHFRLGLLATTSIDMVFSAAQIYSALQAGDKTKALQHALQTLSSAAYLSIMLTAALEYILLSVLIQATTQFIQAYLEYKKNRTPEAFAKLGLALIYAARAPGYVALIRQRNELLALHKFHSLLASIARGRRAERLLFSPLANLPEKIEEKAPEPSTPSRTPLPTTNEPEKPAGIPTPIKPSYPLQSAFNKSTDTNHLQTSPLQNLGQQIDKNRVTLTDIDNKSYDFGAHFHPYGQGLVKGMNLMGWSFTDVNGKTTLKLDFKINHFHREQLEEKLTELKKFPREELRQFLALNGSRVTDIDIQPAVFKMGSLPIFVDITGDSLPNMVKLKAGITLWDCYDYDKTRVVQQYSAEDLQQYHATIDKEKRILLADCDYLEEYYKNEPNLNETQKELLELIPLTRTALSTSTTYPPMLGTAQKVNLVGLGAITIGSAPEYHGLQSRVVVEIDGDKSIFDIHTMLSFLDLDPAIRESTSEDVERLKIGQLFRFFVPEKATPFERKEAFFTLPIKDLIAEIIKIAPDMEDRFKHLPNMKTYDILPGRKRYFDPELDEEARKEGAAVLTASLTGFMDQEFRRGTGVKALSITELEEHEQKELLHRTANILKMGLLSTEFRWMVNMQQKGLSPTLDLKLGSSDSVYAQLLVKRNFQDKMPLSELSYDGTVRFFIKFQSDTYQYFDDCAGTRSDKEEYALRPSVLEFTKGDDRKKDHELMTKDRIPPQNILGVLVPDAATKKALVDHWQSHGLTQNGTIQGKPVDKFIFVGQNLSNDLLSTAEVKILLLTSLTRQ